METQTVQLHLKAPDKPVLGAACNGCGVCCAAEPCPAGQLLFLRRKGACPALTWEGNRYACGIVTAPGRHLSWLPKCWHKTASQLFARWIAAGKGCDSTAEIA